MKYMPENRSELMQMLSNIRENPRVSEIEARTIFATALLYLISELVPPDRTTRHVLDNIGRLSVEEEGKEKSEEGSRK